MLKNTLSVFIGLAVCCLAISARGQQVLTMKEAIQTALNNYGTIKARANQLNSSRASLKETQTQYLPDFSLSAQQTYGTINGATGPAYGYRGLNVASSGPPTAQQNWDSAFGALYLANVSWDFFAFGRAKERIKVQRSVVDLNVTDLQQEQFQHEVRVAATYLNLLAAQRLSRSWEENLKRAAELRRVVVTRVQNGLNAGVDSSLANAEVSRAKIALTQAKDAELEQINLLAQYIGVEPQGFLLDSVFLTRAPRSIEEPAQVKPSSHPVLQFYQNRIGVSDEQVKYYKTFAYPTFSLFGVFQGRGTGFAPDYISNLTNYTRNYGAGVDPTRFNYLFGVGMIWNLTTPFRVQHQVKAQRYTSMQLRDEYELVNQRLHDQTILADGRISNALKNYREAPVQVKAASDAYLQKSTLYKNGLSNIVDFTNALYTVNRAETDRDIAFNNVWQALLYKAASTGDFGLFINNF